jgi:putative inorganic carbon (HCO3(-)) transporter
MLFPTAPAIVFQRCPASEYNSDQRLETFAPTESQMALTASIPRADLVTDTQLSLSVGSLLRGFFASPWSFRFTCLYVFWEYVRPQSVYSWLQGPPWSLISLLLAVLAFVAEGFPIRSRTPLNALMIAFSALLIASSFAAYDPSIAFGELNLWLNWVLAFLLIANTANTERRWFIFALLMMLWSTKMSQHGFRTWATRGFGFASWGVTGGPGWFQNSGEFALQMGIFFPLSLYLLIAVRKHVSRLKQIALWLLPISAVGSIIASSSRGGLLALAAIGLWFVVRSRHRVRTTLVTAVLAPLFWAIVPEAQKARFETAGEDKTSLTRLQYWRSGVDMADGHPLLGVGHGNWSVYYRDHYWNPSDSLAIINSRGEPIVEVAHNSFVEVMSQLGYTGLLLFCSVLGGIWLVNARSRVILLRLGERGRLLYLMSLGLDAGVISIVIAGFFMSVAFYPFVWFQAAMTAGLHAAATKMASGGVAKPSSAPKRSMAPGSYQSSLAGGFAAPAKRP